MVCVCLCVCVCVCVWGGGLSVGVWKSEEECEREAIGGCVRVGVGVMCAKPFCSVPFVVRVLFESYEIFFSLSVLLL